MKYLDQHGKTVPGKRAGGHKIPFPSEDCNRDCVDCRAQFTGATLAANALDDVRMLKGVPNEEAREKARGLAAQNKADHVYVKNQLIQYGDAISARWRKKSKAKRERLMLETQPDLYEHNSIIQRLSYKIGGEIREGPLCQMPENARTPSALYLKQHKAMLVPYLNVEMLKDDPMRLLSLLYYRTAFGLDEWASFDLSQMKLGWESGWVDQPYNDNSLILHGQSYGKLVPYEKEEAHAWKTVGYPRGILVLEAQSTILSFLRKMVNMLVGSNGCKEGDSEWKRLTSLGFRRSGEVEYWSPLVNAAFSAPPIFSPQQCLLKAEAQLAAAEDHLWFLQTDPAYFQHSLNCQLHTEAVSKMETHPMWSFLAKAAIYFPILHVRHLRGVVMELRHVVKIFDTFRDQININSSLPEEYEHALGALEWLCSEYYQHERKALNMLMRRSKGFERNFFVGTMDDGRTYTNFRRLEGYGAKLDAGLIKTDPLFYGLYRLTFDPRDPHEDNPPARMAFVEEHLATADGKERSRIDQTLYDHLSRMCYYYELVWAVRLHQPCPRWFKRSSLTSDDFERSTWRRWECFPDQPTSQELDQLAPLLRGFSEASWPKGKKDESWLAKATESRSRLAEFWGKAREVRRRQVADIGFTEADIDEDLELFSADLSNEYRQDVEAEQDAVKKRCAEQAAKKVAKVNAASHQTQTVWGQEPTGTISLPIGRTKTKTRPEVPAAETVEVEHAVDVPPPDVPHIAVNSNSLSIFQKMFPSSAQEDRLPATLKWKELVTVMTDAGFAATHTGGSMVTFESKSGDDAGQRSIVFYKPHPEPNVDPVTLQMMGRRLRKRFAWTRDTFVEREKTSNQ